MIDIATIKEKLKELILCGVAKIVMMTQRIVNRSKTRVDTATLKQSIFI